MDKTKLQSLLVVPQTTIKGAMQKLKETSERILFVVNKKDKLLGTVTDGDIRTGLINGLDFVQPIRKVMYRRFVAVKTGTPDIQRVVKQLMVDNKIEQIPVLDESGVITDVFLWTDLLGKRKSVTANKILENAVVVMAGGKGTRLDPFTRILPKPLIPIGNKPIIELIMESFYQYGFHRFVYSLNYKKEYIKLFLKENKSPYQVSWVEEDNYMGTAGSLALLKNRVKDTFFVTNCDSLLRVDYQDVLKWHRENKAIMTILGCHNEVKIPFGVLQSHNGILEKILEKPVHDMIINTGVYVMEPKVISYMNRKKKMDMNELIEVLVKKEKVVVYPIYGGWVDIGQWEEYKKSVEQFSLSD
jgi:dTDP-glucose pyrophosphorylase/predicted transcriptional regulator